jgi:acetyl esterase/lipase
MAVGGSAGANLAAMLNTSADVPELQDDTLGYAEYNTKILGSVNWYTPTDFTKSDEGIRLCGLDPFPCPHMIAGSPESSYMGGAIEDLPYEVVQKANPMTYVTKDMPPIFLQHGTKDALVPFYNSIQFAEKVREVCGEGRARLELLLGAEHTDRRFETDENMEKVFAFIDQIMRSGSL